MNSYKLGWCAILSLLIAILYKPIILIKYLFPSFDKFISILVYNEMKLYLIFSLVYLF